MTESESEINLHHDEEVRRSAAQVADDEINLLEYLLVLVKNKRMILTSSAVAFVLACILSLLMPNIYSATARILPPQEKTGGLGTMLGGASDLAALAGISIDNSSGELYVGMLQSRSIADALIDRFKLMEVYDQDYRVKTYEALSEHATISLGKDDGIISVTVEDEEPVRAAAMANAYVEEFKKLNLNLNLSKSGRERLFLENRLELVKVDLKNAEERLTDFQKSNKTIRIDDQATVIIEAIALLKGEQASKEVELGVLKSSQTEQNPQVKALRESIVQIKAQIDKLAKSSKSGTIEDIFIATADVPELGIQYGRLLRDLKIQEALFELLTKQYEMAKISEAKDTSSIQVLDDALVPDKKAKPKRSLIVLAITFVVGFFSLLWAFIREYGQRMPEEDRQLWTEIKHRARFR
jgi:uncharacterized protein involved in exopolysaccharide biosynthesis